MTDQKSIILPDIPGAGDELEDYIAALFQASGRFVVKQVVEADPLDLLELDIVATMYSLAGGDTRLVEVKGGRWGYTDLFKVVGWMHYLHIKKGGFFVTDWLNLDGCAERFAPLNLDVVRYNDFEKAAEKFTEDGFGSFVEPDLIGLWRHSYNLERTLIKEAFAAAKAGSEGGKAAKKYYKLINNGTFFARSPEESLGMLYDAYMDHPKIALGCAQEIDGGAFDAHAPSSGSAAYGGALRDGKQPLVQACMYLEHRARLAILKGAVDYALQYPKGPPATENGTSSWPDLDFHILPRSFKSGLKWLMEQEHYPLYATFWQQFLWGWGGFYLDDRTEDEFAWMSEYSGIPAEEIPTALEAFDRFFPGVDWFVAPGRTATSLAPTAPTPTTAPATSKPPTPRSTSPCPAPPKSNATGSRPATVTASLWGKNNPAT
jgi:hypothetical protein